MLQVQISTSLVSFQLLTSLIHNCAWVKREPSPYPTQSNRLLLWSLQEAAQLVLFSQLACPSAFLLAQQPFGPVHFASFAAVERKMVSLCQREELWVGGRKGDHDQEVSSSITQRQL